MKKANKVTVEKASEGFKNIGAKRVPTAADIDTAKGLGIDLENPKSAMDRIIKMGYEQGNARKRREASTFKTRKSKVRTEEEQVQIDYLLAELTWIFAKRVRFGCPDSIIGVRDENSRLRKISNGLTAVCGK